MEKYPNREDATRGPALTGIENERPETKRIYTAPVDEKKLPFDLMDVIKHDLPWTASDM
jgi:arylsulfatase